MRTVLVRGKLAGSRAQLQRVTARVTARTGV
jgi:hypothetical protein